jgi:hypothetical protein
MTHEQHIQTKEGTAMNDQDKPDFPGKQAWIVDSKGVVQRGLLASQPEPDDARDDRARQKYLASQSRYNRSEKGRDRSYRYDRTYRGRQRKLRYEVAYRAPDLWSQQRDALQELDEYLASGTSLSLSAWLNETYPLPKLPPIWLLDECRASGTSLSFCDWLSETHPDWLTWLQSKPGEASLQLGEEGESLNADG